MQRGNVDATISAKIFSSLLERLKRLSPDGSLTGGCSAERQRGAADVTLFDGIKEKMSCSEQGSIISLSVGAGSALDCETPQQSHGFFFFFFSQKTPLPNYTKVLGELPL